MKNRILIISVMLSGALSSMAQQDALFSQYMFNMMLINPAYTGSRDVISLTALHRQQWLNVDGAPKTTTFSADMPLKNEKMGIGLTVFNDQIGVTNSTGFYANYAYRLRVSEKGTFSMGASAGLTNYKANLASVKHSDDGTEDIAFSSNYSKILPNLGLGVFYNTDKLYVGLSMPHVLNNKLENDPGVTSRQFRHAYLMGGYVFDLNHNFKLRPSALLKYVSGAPIQLDLNVNLWMYDKVAFGLSYRSLDAPLAMVEVQITQQLRFGYAFDFSHSINPSNNLGRTTHEVLLRYEFGYDKGKVLSPRYF